jgi:flagellar motor switch/type III secretory pathway protein FliN
MSLETNVRDLVPVRSQDLAQLERHARDVLKAWAADWLPVDAAWQPEVRAMCCTESTFDTGHETGAWQAHDETRVAAMMNGRERTAPAMPEADWTRQAAGHSLADLHVRMLGGELAADSQGAESGPDLRQLSGVRVVTEASLGLSWAWAARPTEPGKPTTEVEALSASLSTQRVQLAVGLGEVDITMSDLLALQIGDVIRFPAMLKLPVPFSVGTESRSAKPAGQVQLGQLDGHVAVKLSSSF